MKVKSESEVAQSCPTITDPMDCSLPGSSVHGICQARVLEWGAIAFSESCLEHMNLFCIFIVFLNLFIYLFAAPGLSCQEKAMATQSSTLAWKNPMDGGAW